VDQPLLGTLRSPLGPLVILGLIRFLIPKILFLFSEVIKQKDSFCGLIS